VQYVLSLLTCSDHVGTRVDVRSVLHALTHPFYVISSRKGRRRGEYERTEHGIREEGWGRWSREKREKKGRERRGVERKVGGDGDARTY
jgi:rRNA processing protein Gar1